VQAGDTLAEIAAEYGVTVSDLAALNNIDNIDRIEVGQELIIPLAGE
jgi:LysM repeat protein